MDWQHTVQVGLVMLPTMRRVTHHIVDGNLKRKGGEKWEAFMPDGTPLLQARGCPLIALHR